MKVKNKKHLISSSYRIYVAVIILFIIRGCKINIHERQYNICYENVDKEIVISHISPKDYYYEGNNNPTNTKDNNGKITIYFIENFNDSVEVYIGNKLVMRDFLTSNFTKAAYIDLGDTIISSPHVVNGNTCKHITYNIKKNKPFPVFTIKILTKGKEECMQTILDTRYSYVEIWKFKHIWKVMYRNIYFEYAHCTGDTVKLY